MSNDASSETESETARNDAVDPTGPESVDIVVIGSGFAGLCVAIKLREEGFESFVVLEKGSDVGGTWRDNTYPGCGCDVPSHLYSLSFELNSDWSRMYPTQGEIWSYLQDCAAKHDLLPKIRFNSEVREAVFDEEAMLWNVRTGAGAEYRARFVISGMGGLCRPKMPNIPGIDSFQGPSFHSKDWDHSLDIAGKRVAVIGTGASAIQFVPQIAPEVKQLHLFQRSPPWILPKFDWAISDRLRGIFRTVPGSMRALRWLVYWVQESIALGYTVSPGVLRFIQKQATKHLHQEIVDPELRERLTPDYSVGCKRTLISNNYLPTFERDNVELVTDGVTEIREHAVVTQDGAEREVDAIIFATGFDTMDFLSPVRFVGRAGEALNERWDVTPEAYFGVATRGFPNLFFVIGPNSRVANNSIVFMIESQVHYVIECLKRVRKTAARTIEVRPEAQAAYNEVLQARMGKTVFVTGCRNWYTNAEGKSPILWPSFSFRYWMKTRRVDFDAFQFRVDPPPAVPKADVSEPDVAA